MGLTESVYNFSIQNNLIKQNDKIIVGVSGGPDSLCLLNIFLELRDKYNLTLVVAHVNHMLRPEADAEEEFVRKFSRDNNIAFFSKKVDINSISSIKHESTEDIARGERYSFFNELLIQENANKIAVAHNLNDNIETVLMHLIRGVGISGLTGIEAKSNNIIRPLLNTRRVDIELYCKEHNLTPQIDKTNFLSIYTRNKIRNSLIPKIEEINPNFSDSILRLINIIKDEEVFIEDYIVNIYRKVVSENEFYIRKKEFLELNKGLQRRILRRAISCFKGDLLNISYTNIENALTAIAISKNSNIIKITNDVQIFVNYDKLEFVKKKEENIEFNYKLNIPGNTYIKEIGIYINATVIDKTKTPDNIIDKNIRLFDIEKTGRNLYIRNREIGDKFQPTGMNGTKKMKDFFSDLKIPTKNRDKIPLLTNGKDIIWVLGYRTSRNFTKDKNTREVIILSYGKNI